MSEEKQYEHWTDKWTNKQKFATVSVLASFALSAPPEVLTNDLRDSIKQFNNLLWLSNERIQIHKSQFAPMLEEIHEFLMRHAIEAASLIMQ